MLEIVVDALYIFERSSNRSLSAMISVIRFINDIYSVVSYLLRGWKLQDAKHDI